jgi:uncharacterized membrane protein YfcA
MTLLALLYGALVGLSLGLTGGGGSIFAVPLLVYGLDLPFRAAVTVSLMVVGATSLYGATLQARRNNVVWGAGAVLGLGGIISSPLGSTIGGRLSEELSLLLFSLLMVFIGTRMVKKQATTSTDVPVSWVSCAHTPGAAHQFSLLCAAKLISAGAVTGILAGIFGVGGGFLLLPALLIVARLPIHQASGTSLVSIVLICAAALAANLESSISLWSVTNGVFLLGALIGMTTGSYAKELLPAETLRRTFAGLVLATALWILAGLAV